MTFEIDANETEHTRDAIVNWVYNAPGGAQTTGSVHVCHSHRQYYHKLSDIC